MLNQFDFKKNKNKIIHPDKRNKPPIGVKGPKILVIFSSPKLDLFASKYNEPLNNKMPKAKQFPDHIKSVFVFLNSKIATINKAPV